ncbi:MAG: VapD family protein, partial [Oscillospiraceae bacterium]
MQAKHFKAINFDLDTKKLKEIYDAKHYTKAYADIKKSFTQNGFKHRQGSGYKSDEKLTDAQLVDIIEKLFEEYPKIKDCINRLDVTNVGKDYDLLEIFNDKTSSIPIINMKAPDKTDTMEYYEAEINKRQKQRQQLPHGEDIAIEKSKQDKE